jgi:hypothetical protein
VLHATKEIKLGNTLWGVAKKNGAKLAPFFLLVEFS